MSSPAPEDLAVRTTPANVTLVVGMHRSGTSTLTRGLLALGVPLGDQLATEAALDNTKGHWEDREVVGLNDRLLGALGMRWDETGPIREEVFRTPSLAPLQVEAAQLLDRRLADVDTWAFKDPRSARLLPFWLQILNHRGCTVRLLWAIRDPVAVARSLARRNGFSELKSSLLWLRHNLCVQRAAGNLPCVPVDYDRLLQDGRRELARIAVSLDLGAPDPQAVAEFCNGFVDVSLNHAGKGGPADSVGVMELSDRAYRLLQQLARGEATVRDTGWQSRWQAVEAEFSAYDEVCHHIDAQTSVIARFADSFDRISMLQEEARERDLKARIRASDEQAKALIEQHARIVDETLRRLTDQLDEREQANRSLRERIDEQAAQNRLLQGTIDGLEARLEAQTLALEDANAEQRRLAAEATSERRRLADQADRLSKRTRELDATIRELNRERYTVLRPVARKIYRSGARAADHLPRPLWSLLRRIKRRIHPATVALELTVGHGSLAARESSPLLRDVLAARQEGKADVIVFPVIDWHFRFQRPQHLAQQLAGLGHRVFYLSTTFADTLEPEFRIIESPSASIFIIQLGLPGFHPNIYADTQDSEGDRLLVDALSTLRSACNLGGIVSIVDLPFWRAAAQSLPGSLLVYDCMDYHGGFSTNGEQMLAEENRLLKAADLVITTSDRLSSMVSEIAPNVLIRNAGDIAYFSTAPEAPAYESEKPVVGYLGAIAEWFDVDLVTSAARRFPEWQFVLVGSAHNADVSSLRRLPNVELIGEVPYDRAAAWVHSFDVALIPFHITELTLCTNPVKAYEYLAAGKPVVSTALPEVELMDGMVHVARDQGSFHELLQAAMAEAGDVELAASRAGWAARHDWRARGEALQNVICESYPLVSVIVLTYNNLEFTRACLQSLEAHTHYPNWELIVVDNASTDGTPEFLESYAGSRSHVTVILNQENTGFAAGNNQGMAAASGDCLVLLNNDTYVTDGWLLDLVRHLKRNPRFGLVGPVTNNIGNEARIDIHYADMQEMAEAAVAYTSRHSRELLEVRVVAFFCVAVRRDVYEQIGPLDESFGRGFFEDDDYCNRVREAGYTVGIAEDVFVHHHLSGSFDKLESRERNALFQRNKAIYEEKWGAWIPHRYRD